MNLCCSPKPVNLKSEILSWIEKEKIISQRHTLFKSSIDYTTVTWLISKNEMTLSMITKSSNCFIAWNNEGIGEPANLCCIIWGVTVHSSKNGVCICNIIQLFHAFFGNWQNYCSRGTVDELMHCCPRPLGRGQQCIRSSKAPKKRWFWLLPTKAWNSCFITQLMLLFLSKI